jgi:hypothetical protein
MKLKEEIIWEINKTRRLKDTFKGYYRSAVLSCGLGESGYGQMINCGLGKSGHG